MKSLTIAGILLFFLMISTLNGGMRADIEYGRASGQTLVMDAYFPEGEGTFPAVILVHGGAWVGGDRRVNVQPLFTPLTDAGYAVFSISYRFATDIFSFGLAIDDVRQSIRHVRANAAGYHIDPARIALLGESAGGHLSLMAALKSDDPQESLSAVVALYPPTDLVTMARNSTLIPEGIRESIRGTPWADLILAGLRRFSPIEYVRQHMPPFLLIHGTADTLVPFDQSRQMCDKIRSAGGSCELVAVPDAPHGIRRWETLSAAAGYKRSIVGWLARYLGPAMVPATAGQ